MKIMSEKTGKEYSSVEACLAAEKEYDEKIAAEKVKAEKALAVKKEKEEKLALERKADAAKIDEARKAVVEANKAYNKAMNEFLEKYGSYHKTVKYTGKDAVNAWNDFFDSMFDRFWF